jgi:hypothetical protein
MSSQWGLTIEIISYSLSVYESGEHRFLHSTIKLPKRVNSVQKMLTYNLYLLRGVEIKLLQDSMQRWNIKKDLSKKYFVLR